MGIGRLKDLCKEIGASVSGSKDELVDRIIQHVGADRDLAQQRMPELPVREEHTLDEQRFSALFARLRGYELAAILSELELRRWGSKEMQLRTLWEAYRAEGTLLRFLSSSDLEGLLRRVGLRTTGSKTERIARCVQHFAEAPMVQLQLAPGDESTATDGRCYAGTGEPADPNIAPPAEHEGDIQRDSCDEVELSGEDGPETGI